MRPSATVIVRFAAISGALVTAAIVVVALSIRTPPGAWTVRGDAVDLEGSGTVVALRSSAGRFELAAIDLLDEPDVLETWAEMRAFFERQTRLRAVLDGDGVVAELEGGREVSLEVRARSLGDLHWTFFSQLVAALVAFLAGLVTFAYSDRGPGARAYALGAIGMAFVLWPAVVYTTRGLAIDGDVFRALSLLDHAGGHLYANAFVCLFAVYPVRLVRSWAPVAALGAVAFVLEVSQVLPMAIVGFYTVMSVYILAFLAVAPLQWWRSRRAPVTRAAFGWILIAQVVGMAAFSILIVLPMVVGLGPLISQGVALPLYALTFAGISLGVLRVRLFDLDRWWFRAWSWVLGGTAMILADAALMSLFDLEHHESLLLALAVLGWVYFPARQWLWSRLGGGRHDDLVLDVGDLAAARDEEALRRALAEKLHAAFAPLRLEERDGAVPGPRLSATGDRLTVPRGAGHFVCHFRNGGRDLYRAEDLRRAARLVAVCDSVERALHAHHEGEEAERQRIRRDLHDDMGASIIRIIHAADDPAVAALAKHTMRDLRNVLLALSPEPAQVEAVIADLRAELSGLATDARPIRWAVDGAAGWELHGRRRANLVRVLREATTNAVRHGEGPLELGVALSDDALEVVLENRCADTPTTGTGLGLSSVRARVAEIGGTLEAQHEGGVFRLAVRVPRELPA